MSYSFNDTDLSLDTHIHIGLKSCVLPGNSEILIKSALLTSNEVLLFSHKFSTNAFKFLMSYKNAFSHYSKEL